MTGGAITAGENSAELEDLDSNLRLESVFAMEYWLK
jgi:hypothetical protein